MGQDTQITFLKMYRVGHKFSTFFLFLNENPKQIQVVQTILVEFNLQWKLRGQKGLKGTEKESIKVDKK